jgi:predicted PhzF superfamily epimerase YddE/YHI9
METLMNREYRFLQVDVFTDGVFGGNPLACSLPGEAWLYTT